MLVVGVEYGGSGCAFDFLGERSLRVQLVVADKDGFEMRVCAAQTLFEPGRYEQDRGAHVGHKGAIDANVRAYDV